MTGYTFVRVDLFDLFNVRNFCLVSNSRGIIYEDVSKRVLMIIETPRAM